MVGVEVAAVGGEGDGDGVADEGGSAVDELHAAVVGGVALNDACEVP